jgi:hypothetical protein
MTLNLLSSARARDERVETRVISKGQVWSVDPRGGLEVHCRSGSIWVTAGREDVVLEPGERKIFRSRFPVVIEALTPAEMALSSFD